jgi:hypothetical protein
MSQIYIPDNYDKFLEHELAKEVCEILDEDLREQELPWVTVPQDNGNYSELYFKEGIKQ